MLSLSRDFAQADKLSTTGYGHEGEGDDRMIVPITSLQKLTNHEKKDHHKQNVERQAAAEGGGSLTVGSAKMYFTITHEDDLCTCLTSPP